MDDESNARRPRPMTRKDAQLDDERCAEQRAEEQREMRRACGALADEADLRSLDIAAYALHVRLTHADDGVARVLWSGWLEDWAEFYQTHTLAVLEDRKPLSAANRARLVDYRRALDAFGALFELTHALEERAASTTPSRAHDAWFALRLGAAFLRAHGGALATIRASRRQLVASFPRPFDVAPDVTRH